MRELTPGGVIPLPDGTLTMRAPATLDLSVIITGDSGRVDADADFVFYNQPTTPGVRLHGSTVTVERNLLRAGATRLTLAASPAQHNAPIGRPELRVSGRGLELRFTAPATPGIRALLLAEVYRRGGEWRLRAMGQGYADGLAGIARDYGVDVTEDNGPAAAPTSRAGLPTGAQPNAGPSGATPHTAGPHAAAPYGADPHRATPGAAAARSGTSDPYSAAPRSGTSDPNTAAPRSGAPDPNNAVPRSGDADSKAAFPRAGTAFPRAADPSTAARPATSRASAAGGAWISADVSEVIALTNAERARHGMRPLAHDVRLSAVARKHSADMLERGYFSHTGLDGRQPWDRAKDEGIDYRGIAENIAWGQRSAAEVVDGWMNSPGHRANILTPEFTNIGVGRVGDHWTQLFGLAW
ncbi:CAP domain-containing protein [Nocardia acididurans]|uniref:CAP domain-containing protein n=1 Tax=Nocardia acididurans TaxID=2802282 RepID=UPI0027DBC36D|nr:CAP domain-containing protein [Nocardia acididurans]